ncbi:MAG: 23S rRNA (adenine(2503)-C(2))-methyltransferase RlmN [Elusimicrobiota bacterium]
MIPSCIDNPSKVKNIKNLTIEKLKQLLNKWDYPSFHAQQIFNWLYSKRAENFDEMTNLSKKLRKKLKKEFSLNFIEPVKKNFSEDGTVKFLYKLEDGNKIETVVIPEKNRNTLCVSSQVGCKYGCKFCVSGVPGFKRNLKTYEIIDQYLVTQKYLEENNITNIVFMGIGEPLDNFENTVNSIKILSNKPGANIGRRKITVSTCGVVPGIKRLADEIKGVNLGVSLHTASDKKRNTIMPVNKKYNLRKLIFSLKDYVNSGGREVTFEYLLMDRFNSQKEDAHQLARYVKGVNSKLNIILYNENNYFDLKPPDRETVENFLSVLDNYRIPYTFRSPRGRDIEAACGQLKIKDES